MHWIALLSPAEEFTAWSWRALQFTPRVAQLGEALLLEISGSERLFGGRRALLRRLFETHEALSRARGAQGPSSLIALALLRLKLRGVPLPLPLPDALPLDVLDAAAAALPALARTGCRSWGALRALPRAGVARRFGAPLLDALDTAYGERPESHRWLLLPEVFDLKLELPALATSAPELMWSAQRLLGQLQLWLQARQRGVLALEFEWTLDLRRLNGRTLPLHEQLQVRTAQPTQDMAHLRRLSGEQLARASLAAPASSLRLRSLETLPWAGASRSFLPEDNLKGEKLHQLVERLSARLGDAQVLLAQAQDDHRPERMQCWLPARQQVAALARTLTPKALSAREPQGPWIAGRARNDNRTGGGVGHDLACHPGLDPACHPAPTGHPGHDPTCHPGLDPAFHPGLDPGSMPQLRTSAVWIAGPARNDSRGSVLPEFSQRSVLPECSQTSVLCHSGLEPESMPCATAAARGAAAESGAVAQAGSLAAAPAGMKGDCLYPTWLLPEPLRLEVHRNTPHFHGPLRLLTRAHRVEAAWWDAHCQGMALRDYFIARSQEAGLVWIYCERPASLAESGAAQARWFLQGLYA